jgi:hypothetical protein
MLGVDYAGGRPGGAAIAAAGYGFAVRYLSSGGPDLPGKLLLPGEADDLQAHGVLLASNFESTATTMLGGAPQGAADARAADDQHAACGGPPERPIYFSADWDASDAQLGLIAAYLTACATVLGGVQRVGVYGSARVVAWALRSGLAAWGWQTAAWSGGARAPGAHIYQRIEQTVINGVACDVNEALAEDFGQWQQHPTPAAVPAPAEDDTMHLIQSTGRGIALVGPGYYRHLTTDEEVAKAVKGYGLPPSVGNDREFDLDVSLAIGGQGISGVAAALTSIAAAASGVHPSVVDEAALAAALAPHLSTVTVDQITAALKAALTGATITPAGA